MEDLGLAIGLTGEPEATAALQRVREAVAAVGGAVQATTYQQSEHDAAVLKLSSALESQITTLKAQKTILMDPAERKSIQEAAALKVQIDNVTRSLLSRVEGTRENIAMIKAEADAEARQTEAVKAAAKAIADEHAAIMAKAQAEASSIPSVRTMTDELGKQTAAMRARLEVMRSAEGQGYIKAQQELSAEMSSLTKVTRAHDEVEKGVFSNMRTRREAMVMAHEAMMGQTKNLLGSAMVFAEYADLSIMHAATAMINPYTIAAAAVAGLGIALVELNYRAAEHLHAMTLMGMEIGATGEQMIAFEHASIGTGVSARELGTSLSHFTLNLSRHSEELRRAGITAQDPIEAFEQLMDVAKEIQDPIQRDQLLNEALGESYRKMVPLIMQGGDALRDAIKEMKISPEVLEDYEKLNALEVANAKAWDTIKHNSQGALSGISLGLRDIKTGFLDQVKNDGWLTTLGSAIIEPPWLKAGIWGAKGEEIGRDFAEKAKKGAGSTTAILPKDVQGILDKAKEAASKTSREGELAKEREVFQEELSQLIRYGAKKEDLIEAHKAKVAAIEERWRKKRNESAKKEDRTGRAQTVELKEPAEAAMIRQIREQGARDREKIALDIIKLEGSIEKKGTVDLLATKRLEIDQEFQMKERALADWADNERHKVGVTQRVQDEINRKTEAGERSLLAWKSAAYAAAEKENIQDREALIKEAEQKATKAKQDVLKLTAKLRREEANEEAKALKQRMADWDKYSNAVKGHIDSNLSYAITSDDSWRDKKQKIYEDVTHSMINGGIQWVTASIAAQIKEAAFSTATNAAKASESAALQAEAIAAAQLTGAALEAAYFPAAYAVSVATFGAADAEAAIAYSAGQASAMAASAAFRATGGSTLTGGSTIITGDGGRAEQFTPTTPGQITNHVNNSTSSSRTIVYTQMSPTQWAQAARRGEKVQGRTRAGRSR